MRCEPAVLQLWLLLVVLLIVFPAQSCLLSGSAGKKAQSVLANLCPLINTLLQSAILVCMPCLA